jgi:hypothetical protein
VVNLTPQIHHLLGREPQYPLNWRLSGPHSLSARFRGDKIFGFITNQPPSSSVGSHVVLILESKSSKQHEDNFINNYTPQIFLYFITKILQFTYVACMDATLKYPCSISLRNLNTTYHFLGRRQTACYVNYSNSQFTSTPFYYYCS